MCYYPSLTAFKAVLGGEIPDVEVVRKDPKSGDVLGIDNVSKEDANDVSNVQHLSKPQQSAKFKSGVHQVAPHRFLQADFGDMIRMSDLYLDELSSGVEGQTTAMRQARSDIMATAGHFLRLRELYTAALKNQANLINRLQGGVPKARSDTADAPIDLANLKSLHPLLKIMDHPTAEDGPSNWHVDATTPLDLLSSPSASVESVVEHTGAISSSVNVGSVLLLNERHYPQGFATTRLVMPLESLGRVGLVFNRQNEDNFNIVEVEARPGMSPRLQFRQVYQGLMSEPLNRVKLEVDDMDLRRWSGGLPLSLEWGSNGARAAVWREEGVFLGALNPTASAVRTQWIPKHRLTGGQVGMFVDGLVSDGDAVTVAFRSVRWGHSSSLPALASFMVPRAAPAAKGAQRLLQQLADELWKEENAERAEQGIQLEPEEAPEIKPPQIGAVGQAGKAILDSVKRLLVSPTASCQRELFYPKQDGWRLGSDFKASVSGDWSAPGGSIESTLHPKTKQQLDCEKSSSTPEPTSEPRVEVTDPTPLLVTSVSAEASLLVPTALCAGRQSVFWKSRVQAKIKVPAEGRLGFALDIQSDLRVVLLASKTSENDVLVEAVFQNSTGSKDVILVRRRSPTHAACGGHAAGLLLSHSRHRRWLLGSSS
ncbi:MAG: hypothetical protein KVP17_004597 [Porospora cf. gigantea B]|uniref:uncharacterized protein n=1 Tax=Porospora cf. gigantea B TaxID=2853592 RepID=UPI003571848C|nr:MAG: hypothetical protein KVP17_004597 [Porospora cf. gigantea B]